MKTLLAYIIPIFWLISCEPADHIHFLDNNIEVDCHAHEVILTTDEDVNMVGIMLAESDTDEFSEYKDQDCWICKGDWFTITLDKSLPRQVSVTLLENQTDKDRKVVVHINKFIGADMATVVQKAKVAE